MVVVIQPLSCVPLFATLWTALPGSSVHGIFQARALEGVAIAFSENGLEWVNLIQLAIVSTTVGKNALEEMEYPS